MYGRNIVIAATLAVLTLAAPTPTTAVVQREEAIAERRNAFSLTGLVRDVLKRHALIEAMPDAVYEVVADRRSEEVDDDDDDNEDVAGEAEVGTLESDNSKRGLSRGGGGGSKRGLSRGGNGGSKRGLSRGGGGGSKRGLSRGGGGGSKRGLSRGGNGGSK